MSVAVGGRLKPWKVMDPRACMTEADKYLFKQGGSYVSYRTITASSASDSSVQWQCNPPSTSQIVGRLVFVTIEFLVEIKARKTVDSTAQPIVYTAENMFKYISGTGDKNYICPRQFPIASVTETCKLSINGTNIDNDPKKWIHALARYNLSGEEKMTVLSSTPSQPDYVQSYGEFSDINSYGDTYSPFQAFGDNTGEISRGSYTLTPVSYVPDAAANATSGTTTFLLTVTEPLFISPFTSCGYSEKALGQVSEMNVQLNWDTKLERILSIDEVGLKNAYETAANRLFELQTVKVSVNKATNCKISFTYITPQSTWKAFHHFQCSQHVLWP